MKDGYVQELLSPEALYRDQGDRLWWAVLAYTGDREIASDAVAEAFAEAIRSWEAIRSPSAWIWRVAFRVATAELRHKRGSKPLEDSSGQVDEDALDTVLALARLSRRQRAAIVLHYYGGYPIKEIAMILGTAPATVGVHLHRGRKALAEILGEAGDD